MNVRASALAMAIVAATAGLPSAASGQGYQSPAGPTITPYLDYFSVPVGPWLDNYHTYVRPRAELRSNLNRLGAQAYQQERRLNQLGNDFQQMNSSVAAPTGTGSTFMNYSHYFTQPVAHRGGSRNAETATAGHRGGSRGGGGGSRGGFR
jgi:hypothetical protein